MGKQNDVLLKANNEWLYFSSPYQIIKAETLAEVVAALRNVEDLVTANDWYAAGFLSYEAASAFDLALQTKLQDGFPYLWFGLYSEPQAIELPPTEVSKQLLDWHPTIDRERYDGTVEKIKGYISQGKTYQVNYTIRLEADFTGSAWDFFLHLAQDQNNHAAYINTGQYVICSASPELFFQLNENTITDRKSTRLNSSHR